MVGRQHVPVRTIAATIGMVLLTILALLLIRAISRVLVWMAVAAFFAVALYPAVNRLDRRVGGRRWLATLIVFLGAVVVIVGFIALLVTPLVREGAQLAQRAPELVEQARAGRGPLGELVQRYGIDDYLTRNESRIREGISELGTPALHVVQTAAETIAGILTIFVLAYLMVLEGPLLVAGTLALLPDRYRERTRRVGADCARTVTGYLTGNLLISIICGSLTFVVLLILGVPYAGLIAVFVAIADLIPLVGATLGAVVAGAVAFFHSIPAGIATVIFFIVYQQIENHFLQPVIMSRTVKLNPLTVLVAILIGVELAGILGALMAIPVAGIIQVIVRDVYDTRRGQLKEAPTVGADQRPAERAPDDGPDSRESPALRR
jgi:predicted PurR-regulated permease PerM